jgi:preprotein translocase subunit SecA
MLAQRTGGEELPKGLDAAWDAAAGYLKQAVPRTKIFLRRAAEVLSMEAEFARLTDQALREECLSLREQFLRGRETPLILRRAFATIREVAFRQIGERPFLVQVAGAMAIEAGNFTEMATGEGKTLTATMPATVAGWRGKGCHVITTNDYLARRDAEWMTRVYSFCGLTVGALQADMEPPARRQAYLADITYCTNKEVTADYLRDRLALGRLQGLSSVILTRIVDGQGSGTDRVAQRGLPCAIVDEADSILIDEAVTPLIISGHAPNPEQVEAFRQAADLSTNLQRGRDYKLNERFHEVDLTAAGKERLEELAQSLDGLWQGARRREELVTQALTAREFYMLGKQYVLREDKVVIVDEFTGRLMPDREWRDGLHQAVSAKENVNIEPPKDTYARVSFQRFFRLYRKISGMTGTATEGTREFWQIYHCPTLRIPTNRPCIRVREKDRIYATAEAKWSAITKEIRLKHERGLPMLVGTRSVRSSELLSKLLTQEGLEHEVLNAVNEAREAEIVALAGQAGRITVATNMAGRGTDIKLGPGIADKGGLQVIATERHEAGRVDRQLFGRAGRQGDPGHTVAIVSLEDELVVRHAPRLCGYLRSRYGHTSREISNRLTRGLFDIAQHRAERLALRQRKGVLRTDDWLDEYLGFAGKEK